MRAESKKLICQISFHFESHFKFIHVETFSRVDDSKRIVKNPSTVNGSCKMGLEPKLLLVQHIILYTVAVTPKSFEIMLAQLQLLAHHKSFMT